MAIITIELDEDGDTFCRQYATEQEFLDYLNNSNDFGRRGPHFLPALPYDLQSGERGIVVIKGEVIVPKTEQRVVEWTL